MKILIKTTNLILPESTSQYLDSKLQALPKLLTHYECDAVEAQVELAKTSNHHNKGDIYKAVINLHLPLKSLRAEVEGADLHSAIDDLKDTILEELRKYNDILKSK